jgi:hypothetical protein
MAQKIDTNEDDWNVIFKVGDRDYRVDALIYSSLIVERVKENEDPPKSVIIETMKECMDTHEGLTDNQIWALSVRLSKAMQRAGNA